MNMHTKVYAHVAHFWGAWNQTRVAVTLLAETGHMAPVSPAERAALEAFFKSKRGDRTLIEQSADAFAGYFGDKGTTVYAG